MIWTTILKLLCWLLPKYFFKCHECSELTFELHVHTAKYPIGEKRVCEDCLDDITCNSEP